MAEGEDDPFTVRVHSSCPGRSLQDADLFGLEDGVESGGVFAVSVAQQKPHRSHLGTELGGEIPRLLSGPVAGGAGGHAGDMQPSGGVFKED